MIICLLPAWCRTCAPGQVRQGLPQSISDSWSSPAVVSLSWSCVDVQSALVPISCPGLCPIPPSACWAPPLDINRTFCTVIPELQVMHELLNHEHLKLNLPRTCPLLTCPHTRFPVCVIDGPSSFFFFFRLIYFREREQGIGAGGT